MCVCSRKAITTLAFSPDGKYIVTGEVSVVQGLDLSVLSLSSRWMELFLPSRLYSTERPYASGASLGRFRAFAGC